MYVLFASGCFNSTVKLESVCMNCHICLVSTSDAYLFMLPTRAQSVWSLNYNCQSIYNSNKNSVPVTDEQTDKTMLKAVLVVYSFLSGFSTIVGHWETGINKSVLVVCCISTVMYAILSVFIISVKLYYIEFTYISVMDTVVFTLTLYVVVFYRIKYLLHKELNKTIFENINYADDCLRSLGVKIQYRKIRMFNAVLTCAIISYHLLCMHLGVYYDDISSKVFSMDEDVKPQFELVLKYAGQFSETLLFLQFYLVNHAVRERLRLFLGAFDKSRNVGWTDNVIISIVETLAERNVSSEPNVDYKNLRNIYICCRDVVYITRNFYATFFCMRVCLVILVNSMLIVFNANHLEFIFFTAVNIFADISPIFVCAEISLELQNMQQKLNEIYYKENEKSVQLRIKSWIIELAHNVTEYDCDYFNVDLTILPLIIDFVSLFVFAVLPTVN